MTFPCSSFEALSAISLATRQSNFKKKKTKDKFQGNSAFHSNERGNHVSSSSLLETDQLLWNKSVFRNAVKSKVLPLSLQIESYTKSSSLFLQLFKKHISKYFTSFRLHLALR